MPSQCIVPSSSQRTLHFPVFHLISYLTDHQMQITKKEKMQKVSPYLISSFLCTLSQRYLFGLTALFCPNNMEGSKRTITRFGHLCSSTKKKKKSKKTKKIYNLMTESLLSSNTSNRFKFIVTPTRGKKPWPPSQKWNYDS